MQVTMKLLLQSTTARQSKVFYFRIWSLCVLTFGDDFLSKDDISQKAFWRTDCARSVDYWGKIWARCHTNPWTNSFSFMWKAAEYALPVLVCFWVPLFSFYDTCFVRCLPRSFEKEFHHDDFFFVCFTLWFRCWLNLSCRLSSFSNKSLSFSLSVKVHLCIKDNWVMFKLFKTFFIYRVKLLVTDSNRLSFYSISFYSINTLVFCFILIDVSVRRHVWLEPL